MVSIHILVLVSKKQIGFQDIGRYLVPIEEFTAIGSTYQQFFPQGTDRNFFLTLASANDEIGDVWTRSQSRKLALETWFNLCVQVAHEYGIWPAIRRKVWPWLAFDPKYDSKFNIIK